MHAAGLVQPNKIWRVLGSQTAIRASSLPIHSRAGGSRCIRASPYRVSPPDASSRRSSVAWRAARWPLWPREGLMDTFRIGTRALWP